MWMYIVFPILAILLVAALLVFLRRPSKKHPIDSIVGAKCVVTEKIENEAGLGQVMVNGMLWAARSVPEELSPNVGEELTVIAVEGVKLIVK